MVNVQAIEEDDEKEMVPFVFSETSRYFHVNLYHKPTPWCKDDA